MKKRIKRRREARWDTGKPAPMIPPEKRQNSRTEQRGLPLDQRRRAKNAIAGYHEDYRTVWYPDDCMKLPENVMTLVAAALSGPL